MSEPAHDLGTVTGRLRHLAALAGVTLPKLSEIADLSPTTLVFAAGADGLNSKTARKVGIVAGRTPEEQATIAGWLCSGSGQLPDGEHIRAAVEFAETRAQT